MATFQNSFTYISALLFRILSCVPSVYLNWQKMITGLFYVKNYCMSFWSSGSLGEGSIQKETSSPRLQHRVPIFVEGYNQPIPSAVDSMGCATENKKPNVRVIPIEVEGAENRSNIRHRNLSGPVGIPKGHNDVSLISDISPFKHSMGDLSTSPNIKATSRPRVHNIPIKVENASNLAKSPKPDRFKKESPKHNGCSVSKSIKVKSPVKQQKTQETKVQNEDEEKTGIESSLKKIEDVLEEFKNYEKGVEEFTGTTKDKQYRYLDEMLTRCMLRLDDIDTMGNENVRSARKTAVKKVQASVDLLERKANAVNELPAATESEVKSADVQERSKTSEDIADGENGLKSDVQVNDVEMKESLEGNKGKANAVNEQPSTTESEVKLDEQELSKTSEDIVDGQNGLKSDVLGNDVEMKENLEGEDSGVTLLIDKTATDVEEVEMKEKPMETQPEVEMTEIQAASFKNLSTEDEVEMSDNSNTDHSELKSENVFEESSPETVQASSDVEMKDVHNTSDEVKDSIVLENVECNSSQSEEQEAKCTSSQSEKQGKKNMNVEINISPISASENSALSTV